MDWLGSEIQEGSFSGKESLQTVVFANVDGGIGANAFKDCANLKCVSFPKKKIFNTGDLASAFQGCSSLEVVEMPLAVKKDVEESLYANDTSVNSWGIPTNHLCVIVCANGEFIVLGA